MIVLRSFVTLTVLSLAAVACGAADGGDASSSESSVVQAPTPPPAAAPAMSKEIHWFRNSAEYKAITRQTYALAAHAVDAKAAAQAGPWGVVLDVDETVLDNSEYQKENQGKPFDPAAWTSWVTRKEAKAVPGAIGFTNHVHGMGGKVVLVTNRMDGTECPATEDNLKALGVPYDAILCKKDTSDKNPRFKAVATGTAVAGLPAMEILAFVGDNILDLPDESQALASKDDAAFAEFGSRFFTLPNPMYGSWEANPQN